MNEKLIALFIIGMGAIRVYEDFDDGDDYYDASPVQIVKKHNLGKRSIDSSENGVYNPKIDKEEFLEAFHHGLNPKLLMACNTLNETGCSCMRLLCFNEDNCHSIVMYKPSVIPELKFQERDRRWLKKCRQGEIWGQQLCECKRYLTTLTEIVKMEKSLNASLQQEQRKKKASQLNEFGPIFDV